MYKQITPNEFRELIWRERWHELCFEGITGFDMIRLRKVYDEATNSFEEFARASLGTAVTLEEKHLLLPLPPPISEITPSYKIIIRVVMCCKSVSDVLTLTGIVFEAEIYGSFVCLLADC